MSRARRVSRTPRSERTEPSERLERRAAEIATQPLPSRPRPIELAARGATLAHRQPGGRRCRGDRRRGTRRHRTRRLNYCRGRARRETLIRYGSRQGRLTGRLASDPMSLLADPIADQASGALLVAPTRFSKAVPAGLQGTGSRRGAVPVPSVTARADSHLRAAAGAVVEPEGARRAAPLPGTGHGRRGDGH